MKQSATIIMIFYRNGSTRRSDHKSSTKILQKTEMPESFDYQKFRRQKFRRQKFHRQKFRRQKFSRRKLRSIKRRFLSKLLGIV